VWRRFNGLNKCFLGYKIVRSLYYLFVLMCAFRRLLFAVRLVVGRKSKMEQRKFTNSFVYCFCALLLKWNIKMTSKLENSIYFYKHRIFSQTNTTHISLNLGSSIASRVWDIFYCMFHHRITKMKVKMSLRNEVKWDFKTSRRKRTNFLFYYDIGFEKVHRFISSFLSSLPPKKY
jgi:hypothetical protein